MNKLVINIYGSPGAGKSTLAKNLKKYMREKRIDVGLISEFATELIENNQKEKLKDQPYVTKGQMLNITRVLKKHDIAISDSPIELGKFYCDPRDEQRTNELIKKCKNMYKSINFFLKLDEQAKQDYTMERRVHTYAQSKKLQEEMLSSLILNDKTSIIIYRSTPIKEIFKMIEKSKQWNKHQNQNKGLELCKTQS
ncbi:TPA: AAA family ATPase [Campylobacter fetus subsp. venerealis]|uniref:ATP-binding protein (AAA domain) n=1 Tax=Campylobacter fetus subsp. venerealis NCTC 10354 TaxID=983328 RepID=A0AAE6J0A3_CAMFE|nr:AAA family ATPase [Campylobacter fetus]OCS21834.1 hypothetical protein CFVI97532_07710 [Campylobacter fetus subsp. venerealis cfvi97/532]OCS28459.1 hypothetical protein CFVCCUG33900_09120 [Campylobacter fetus subsp. venerealis LMG 6570 = CCUG 33900]AHE95065.1 putative protein (AAA domain) [Campylobacter fetus subsp. venerealis cfvi03/293]AIR81483.1 hypothetical protein (AAA domain) [Campylobacter fetus subsp. venerealis 97/608]EAK0835496.1 hypothetical protein [Campylobacter fetus]